MTNRVKTTRQDPPPAPPAVDAAARRARLRKQIEDHNTALRERTAAHAVRRAELKTRLRQHAHDSLGGETELLAACLDLMNTQQLEQLADGIDEPRAAKLMELAPELLAACLAAAGALAEPQPITLDRSTGRRLATPAAQVAVEMLRAAIKKADPGR